MSTRNPNTIGPAPQFAESGRYVFEAQLAQNTRRQGSRRAEQKLWRDASISSGMAVGSAESGQSDASTPYATKVADGRGVYGRTNPPPSWDAVDDRTKAGFVQGIGVEAGRATPYPWQPREGANYAHMSPLDAMHRGERQNAAYGRKIAPAGGGRGRRSPADVSDL